MVLYICQFALNLTITFFLQSPFLRETSIRTLSFSYMVIGVLIFAENLASE